MSNEDLRDLKKLTVFILLTGSTALICELLWHTIRPAAAGSVLWITALLITAAASAAWCSG